MAGILLGACLGAGLCSIWLSFWPPKGGKRVTKNRISAGLRSLGYSAGLPALRPWHVLCASTVAFLFTGMLSLALSGVPVLAAILAFAAACSPLLLLRMLARRRADSLRAVWPEVVDHIASALRAGLSLPEALIQVGEKGPLPLREPFRGFSRDFQASGDFTHCLSRLKQRLADPVADRVLEALRLTREVGGSDIGTLLATLSSFLRDDLRLRGELAARQSWTVNAARLALCAPWLVLILMSTREPARLAYNSPAGALLMLAGAGISLLAYRVMLAIARLPRDERVFA
ncbi:type II secretion system F family protein [Dermabacteraceae bacterium TAE3-ERU27]|nr:type II secretion system F family protein [Dermabacteraceae bacterium TAE3-ERU27]